MNLKQKARLAMAAFLIACLIPSLGMFLLPSEEAAGNQILASVPSLTNADGSFNGNILQDTTDYVADHFALRQKLITLYAKVNAAVFHTSIEDDVLLGKEGWLFYRETMEDYLHTAPLSDRQLWAAAHTLSLLQEYANQRGAYLLFTVSPNKASLYPQYLPNVGTALEGEDTIERLIPLLEQEQVPYADLFQAFRAQDAVLYYRLDSHWNTKGAALAADTLLNTLGKKTDYFDESYQMVQNHSGDLYEMLYPAGTELDWDAVRDSDFHFEYVSNFHSPEDQYIVTAGEQSGSILVFRDSFGNALYPFLADSYGTAVFSRSMPYQMPLLDTSGADTVLIEIVERNLDWLATRAPIVPAPERVLNGVPPMGNALVALQITDDGTLDGYVRIDGTLSGECDTDSAIYVQWGDMLYEASPVGEDWSAVPFTLYVPRNANVGSVQVYYLLDGALYAAGTVTLES